MEASESDPAAVAACESYAGPLYSYCLWLLADEEQAIAALVDLFAGAQRLGGRLRDPRFSRSLLYTMARSRCLRIRGEQDDHPWPADVAESFAYAEGLSRAEQEMLELSIRHGLDEQDIALVLGESSETVRTLLADAQASLDAAPTLALITPPPELHVRILRGLAESYPAIAKSVAKAVGENTPPIPEPTPESAPRRRRRSVLAASIAIVSVGVAAILLTGGGNAGHPSPQRAATGAGARGQGTSPPPTSGNPPSPSPGLVAGPGTAPPSYGGTIASPTASPTGKAIPIGPSSNPASSAPAAGPPAPTPTPTASGPGLTVTWKPSPQTTTITLTATGDTPVQWSVTVSDSYLSVSRPSGTLLPGQTQTVTVTVDAALAPKGTWHATITVDPGHTVIPVNGGHGKPGGSAPARCVRVRC